MSEFESRNAEFVSRMARDPSLRDLTRRWFLEATRFEYSYHFTWLGRPVIQFPQDLVAMQEIVWTTQPDLIVETGVARGGSLVFYASLLELMGREGCVVGIDVDIRAHNRAPIEAHPLAKRIRLIDGSSVDPGVVATVHAMAAGRSTLVVLDSNHTHDHVLRELELYAPLVRKGGYLVVFDTIVEEMPDEFFSDRPWRKGNSPGSAVEAFLRSTDRFAVDRQVERKLLITAAPGGYLRCVKD